MTWNIIEYDSQISSRYNILLHFETMYDDYYDFYVLKKINRSNRYRQYTSDTSVETVRAITYFNTLT